MVANYIDAQVFYPSNPVGVDAAIYRVQQRLANIFWLQKVFGRCTVQKTEIEDRKSLIVYPEVYQANNEPMNAMPNDNFISYCFFNVHDPGVVVDFDPFDAQTMISRTVSIIFWANLQKISPSMTARYNENMIIDVIQMLKMSTDFIPKQTFERFDTVFQDFTITDGYRNFMKYPFTGFRITGDLLFPAVPDNVCFQSPGDVVDAGTPPSADEVLLKSSLLPE